MKDTTLALLVAGRALDEYLVTHRALARLREVAAGIPDLSVIVASDEGVLPAGTDDYLYARVVIGYVAARVQSEYKPGVTADPFGPIDPAAVEASLQRVRALGDLAWRRVAQAIPVPSFTAAQRRASMTEEQRDVEYAAVALDGKELCATPDRIHLVASGPLAGAVLARGVSKVLPVDEDGEFEEGFDEDGWVFHGGNNERPLRGVFGEEVARAHIEGHGAVALSREQMVGDLFLLAVYD